MSNIYPILPYLNTGQTASKGNGADQRPDSPANDPNNDRPVALASKESNQADYARQQIVKMYIDYIQSGYEYDYDTANAPLEFAEKYIDEEGYLPFAEKLVDVSLGNTEGQTFSSLYKGVFPLLGLKESTLNNIRSISSLSSLKPDAKAELINKAKLLKARILIKKSGDSGNAEFARQAMLLCKEVLSDSGSKPWERADAALKISNELLKDEGSIEAVKYIADMIANGTATQINNAAISKNLLDLGIDAALLSKISRLPLSDETKYTIHMAKLAKAKAFVIQDNKQEAAKLCLEVLKESPTKSIVIRSALLMYANILSEDKATAQTANDIFKVLQSGNASFPVKDSAGATVATLQVKSVQEKDKFDFYSVKLGLVRSSAMAGTANAETKTKAVLELRDIITKCSESSMAFLKESATLELASLLKNNKTTRDEATELFNGLQKSETPFIRKRAVIELCIIALETKESGEENKAAAEANLRAALNDPSLKGFLRNQVALALANRLAGNKETATEAIALYDSVITATTDPYLIASARIGRANILSGSDDKTQKAAAQRDYLDALITIKAADGKVPVEYRRLEIQANKGLTNVVIALDPSASKKLAGEGIVIDGIRVQTREETRTAYKAAREKDEIPEDKYLESEITFEGLDGELNAWHHREGADMAASGRIINNYQAIVDGDYDDMTKNTARVRLARALQTMGQPEEAKKVLAHAVSASVAGKQITEIDMAEVMNNYGFVALGDSDFNLGYEYFRKASEFDQDSPNSTIYRARAAFLTEKFTKEHFTDLYNAALDKVGGTGRPSIEEMAQAALSEDKTRLNEIASTPEGRFMVLTALEAQAKILYAKGNSLKSAQCFEQAKELFEMWKGAGAELPSDYLFEYQLHYDLATVYLSLNRFKDAYNEYKLIAGMPGVPNWFVDTQIEALDPKKIIMVASDNGNIDIAYRRYFERGSFGVHITEDGASADAYLLLGEDKSHAVKVRFGAFNHGVIDAGVGYSKDFGRTKISTGIDYNRDANGNDVIGLNAAAEFKVDRYLTLALDGKYEWHREDVNYGTYEIGASARYVRRIGKDLTFSASGRIAYGTQRDYSVPGAISNNVWVNQFQASTTGESDWEWDTGTSCYTQNSGSDDKFRQRYWINYNVYDLAGKPMSAWHIAAAIEPDTRTVQVATPVYGQLNTETIDVPLNDLFIEGFAHTEGTSVVFNDSRNAVLTSPGEKPSSQEINAIDVNTLTGDATKPRVLTHKESHTVRTATSEYRSVTTITVKGENRLTAEGQYPKETDPWGPEEELYTLEITTTKDPMTGLTQKTVVMRGRNNTAKLLYQGGDMTVMNQKVKAAIEEYYKVELYAGITKKFHGGFLPDGTQVTLSGMLSAKHTPGKARTDNNNNYTPAKDQYDLRMGPSIDARIPAGNGSFNLGAGYIYNGTKKTEKNKDGFIERKWTSGSGWEPEAYVGYTANLSGNDIENGTYVNASVGTNTGPYMGISKGPLNVGVGIGGPQVGVNAHLKIGDTQILGDVPISVSATGFNIAGLPIGSGIEPVTLLAGSIAKGITDSKSLKAIEKEKGRLEKEISDAQNTGDKETAAYLRFIYDNLFLEEGTHQANWLKESTRIPILNLLTALTGTRARKNAGSIIQETRQITGHFSALGASGAFGSLDGGPLSEEARDSIEQYLANETDYQGQKKGNISKIADAQDKVVRGVLTPFRLAGRALHLTREKPEEGCVSEPSFKAVTRKKSVRHLIIEELAVNGYIEPETGRVTDKIKSLDNPSSLGLSDELKDKEEMIYSILKTASRDAEIGTTTAPAAPETDPQLVEAFKKKLHEDAMYLVYRNIAEKGSTPQTRKEIAEILATLPVDVRVNIDAFIENLPADIMFRADKTVRVAVQNDTGKDQKVKVTPETYTRSVMQGESYSGKLAIEKAAVEEFKHGKPSVDTAFANLTDALSKANDATSDLDNDKVNDAVYRSALVLFMLAADDDEKAIAVAEKLDGIEKAYPNILSALKDDISDFILNRRPGSTKIFGGQRDAIKVVNNSLSVKGRRFTVAEYVGLAIAGKLDEEIEARVRAEKLEEEMKKDAHSRTRHGEIRSGNRRSQEKPTISEATPVAQEAADVDAEDAGKKRVKDAQRRYGFGSRRSRQR